MAARLVNCLVELRTAANGRFPGRDKTSDGWIGDAAHAAGKSDHNPDPDGWVHAIDVDRDLRDPDVTMHDVVRQVVADQIAGDDRLEYVIFDRVIWSRSRGWIARAYDGSNPHDKHAHFSARHTSARQSARSWRMPGRPTPEVPDMDLQAFFASIGRACNPDVADTKEDRDNRDNFAAGMRFALGYNQPYDMATLPGGALSRLVTVAEEIETNTGDAS